MLIGSFLKAHKDMEMMKAYTPMRLSDEDSYLHQGKRSEVEARIPESLSKVLPARPGQLLSQWFWEGIQEVTRRSYEAGFAFLICRLHFCSVSYCCLLFAPLGI